LERGGGGQLDAVGEQTNRASAAAAIPNASPPPT